MHLLDRSTATTRRSALTTGRRGAAVLGRHAVLLLVGFGALAGCGSDGSDASGGSPTSTAVETSTTETTSTTSTTQAAVVAEDLANGGQVAPVDVEVDGGSAGVDVTFRKITIPPGGTTGEHCHYGQLVAVVAEGELTHLAPIYPGGVHVYETGDSVIEGKGYPHEGRNEGDTDVVLLVTYVTPEGKPLAEKDLAHCDPAAAPGG